jgi:hypothetical protein
MRPLNIDILVDTCWVYGLVTQLVEALRYKLEGRRFDSDSVTRNFPAAF